MNEQDKVYLGHMLDTADRVMLKLQGIDEGTFLENDTLQLAIAHLVQIIGEAARNVTQETRDMYPSIPWKYVTGMRHRIVHDYMQVSMLVLWSTATISVPELAEILRPDL